MVSIFILNFSFLQSQNEPLNLRGIKVFLSEKKIEISGIVNMQKGLIELLATAPGGKEHESVMVLNCNPALLQTALILIGLEQGGGANQQGSDSPIYGDFVYAYIQWGEGKKQKLVRAETFILDQKSNRPMLNTPWVFTGSQFIQHYKTGEKIFAANVNGILIATYYDPSAILNNPLKERADDTSYYANPKVIPPKGTKITLILTLNPLEKKTE